MSRYPNSPSNFDKGLSIFVGAGELGAGIACKGASVSGVISVAASLLTMPPATPPLALIAILTVFNTWELGSDLIESGSDNIIDGLKSDYSIINSDYRW